VDHHKKHRRKEEGALQACTFPGCDARFVFAVQLKRHLLTHTEDCPYVCPNAECGKAFKDPTVFTVCTKVAFLFVFGRCFDNSVREKERQY
jgi:hypothetical protein